MKLSTTLALVTVAAALAGASGAAKGADRDPNAMLDMSCASVPAGWQINTYIGETSLTEGTVEVASVAADGTTALLSSFAATKDLDTGNASELKDTWTAPGFRLSYDLQLDETDPTRIGLATASAIYDGAGQHLALTLDCY